jgi:hypothetical protein
MPPYFSPRGPPARFPLRGRSTPAPPARLADSRFAGDGLGSPPSAVGLSPPASPLTRRQSTTPQLPPSHRLPASQSPRSGNCSTRPTAEVRAARRSVSAPLATVAPGPAPPAAPPRTCHARCIRSRGPRPPVRSGRIFFGLASDPQKILKGPPPPPKKMLRGGGP